MQCSSYIENVFVIVLNFGCVILLLVWALRLYVLFATSRHIVVAGRTRLYKEPKPLNVNRMNGKLVYLLLDCAQNSFPTGDQSRTPLEGLRHINSVILFAKPGPMVGLY